MEGGSVTQEGICDLSKFEITRVLTENSQRKTVVLLGKLNGNSEKAILVLEKQAFSHDQLPSLCSTETQMKKEFVNDIYGNYISFPDSKLNGIKTTLIYPATDLHVAKYESKPIHIIDESPQLYKTVTLPYITKENFNLQWVYNILEHRKETERIVFEDPDPVKGFVLLPDLKWDGQQVETLYLLAIPHVHGIKSLRDLTDEHLPLLKNIRDQGLKAIEDKYQLKPSQVRAYVHYQPTFYHFHVHFNYLMYDAPGIYTGKAHVLSSVISNIELVPDYYQRASLPFVLNESQGLLLPFKELGVVD